MERIRIQTARSIAMHPVRKVSPLGTFARLWSPLAAIEIVPPKIGDMDHRPATNGSAGRGGGVCKILGGF